MRGFLFSIAMLLAVTAPAGVYAKTEARAANAADIVDDYVDDIFDELDSVVVSSNRAGASTPVASVNVSGKILKQAPVSAGLPMALQMLPGVVATNEGGTDLGYSAMRIRGVPGSQTSVSLNGITLNGAEDQEVFWVNIPGIGGYLKDAQIQRGLGTSSNGPGAFGASIDLNTVTSKEKAMEMSVSRGSFKTTCYNVHVGTGTAKKWFAEAAVAGGHTEGYIRNANADVQSVFATAGYSGSTDLVKATVLVGNQKSGITWEGIPLAVYNAGDYTYNPAGEHLAADDGVQYYDNQTDNYSQTHGQLHWIHQFDSYVNTSLTLNHTKGYGYYEQYRVGFVPLPDGTASDAVTRDILDNNLYVCRAAVNWDRWHLRGSAGVYASRYECDHIGQDITNNADWYLNYARKGECDVWMRNEWTPFAILTFYTDLQLRGVRHIMDGPDEYGQTLDEFRDWLFFNPRVGVSWVISPIYRTYASVALGHREPTRSDIQAFPDVKPERMVDIEWGHEVNLGIWHNSLNLYAMEYHDMLVETGWLNDAGYAVKYNVPRAWRRGVEWASGINFGFFRAEGNLALSDNKIRGGNNLRLSPACVGMLSIGCCWGDTDVSLGLKYVGKQYWDNTTSPDRMVPSYTVLNADLSYIFYMFDTPVKASIHLDNLANRHYYAYAWVYRGTEADGTPYQYEGLYPQAPFNATVKLEVKLW